LASSDWYREGWLDQELALVMQRFEQACERWRGLYKAAMAQAQAQDRVIRDAARSADDKRQAERLRREAEEQLKLLIEVENIAQSDFYSYRYFASEGFLPGYSFPRLPLSAFIPARRTRRTGQSRRSAVRALIAEPDTARQPGPLQHGKLENSR
jgi:hypothetical protein